jgi:hypothetical protein
MKTSGARFYFLLAASLLAVRAICVSWVLGKASEKLGILTDYASRSLFEELLWSAGIVACVGVIVGVSGWWRNRSATPAP